MAVDFLMSHHKENLEEVNRAIEDTAGKLKVATEKAKLSNILAFNSTNPPNYDYHREASKIKNELSDLYNLKKNLVYIKNVQSNIDWEWTKDCTAELNVTQICGYNYILYINGKVPEIEGELIIKKNNSHLRLRNFSPTCLVLDTTDIELFKNFLRTKKFKRFDVHKDILNIIGLVSIIRPDHCYSSANLEQKYINPEQSQNQ